MTTYKVGDKIKMKHDALIFSGEEVTIIYDDGSTGNVNFRAKSISGGERYIRTTDILRLVTHKYKVGDKVILDHYEKGEIGTIVQLDGSDKEIPYFVLTDSCTSGGGWWLREEHIRGLAPTTQEKNILSKDIKGLMLNGTLLDAQLTTSTKVSYGNPSIKPTVESKPKSKSYITFSRVC